VRPDGAVWPADGGGERPAFRLVAPRFGQRPGVRWLRAPGRVGELWGPGRVEGYGTMVQENIIAWSSWLRLWQCATYGPTKSRNPR
jgi:hypothetical protein